MRAAPELLGAQTIGGGCARPGVVVEGVKERSQISLPSRPECTETAGLPHLFTYNIPKTLFFFT